ncbi:MAG: hypothetical protein O7I93_03485 [Gemmatimonadetes bacterium]|nr:hypothetical protein [Gemmatimonadota bacterium]
MRAGVLVGVALAAALPGSAAAQTFEFHLEAVGLTYQEVREGRDAVGKGGGAGIVLRVKRFGLDVRGYTAEVEPDSGGAGYDFRQIDVRLSYRFSKFLALEVGGGRRYVTPEFATQEVGVLRIGVLSENDLTQLAKVWVRGAYLANPQFSGGGTGDVAFEFGLGVALGAANGRFRVRVEYEFQRIDREVGAASVPLQLSLARAGIAFGF